MTWAKPLKKASPSSKFEMANSSSKEAPAQNAFSPSDFKRITDTPLFSDSSLIVSVSLCNNSATNELLAGWPNSTCAT